MIKKILIFSLLIPSVTLLPGQNDKEAVSLLSRFSSKASSAPSVSMKFQLITDDQAEKTTDTLKGSVIISRDSYRLDLPDNIIWFNGETSWSYLPAEKEVTITKPDKKDDSFQNKPSSIFTMYKKGYKNRLVEEKPDSYLIDLYPEDIKSELIRVRLNIGKPSLELKSLEYKRRDGVTITLYVKEYGLTKIVEPGIFKFSPEKYKDVDIVDMR